jgi:hypothetical protein
VVEVVKSISVGAAVYTFTGRLSFYQGQYFSVFAGLLSLLTVGTLCKIVSNNLPFCSRRTLFRSSVIELNAIFEILS